MNDFLNKIEWSKRHIIKCYTRELSTDITPIDKGDIKFKSDGSKEIADEYKEIDSHKWIIQELRKDIEPWLTSVFQSEHFSLLIGTGLTCAAVTIAKSPKPSMASIVFDNDFNSLIHTYSTKLALSAKRGDANIEDDFNAAFKLLDGYEILGETEKYSKLKEQINTNLLKFINDIVDAEIGFSDSISNENGKDALRKIQSFLISFSARAATRERLNVFTLNYDRFLEFGLDTAGVLCIDRFVGKIRPVLRTTKLDLDYHYNPPGIRGEPRYVEGVVRFTKLHGSIDWNFENNQIIRTNLPFGSKINLKKEVGREEPAKDYKSNEVDLNDLFVIYPNSAKGIDTVLFPYAELFRDFSSSVCRPNSVIVTYGYGFGDSHVNRIMRDMLTIPSTHLVVISWDQRDDKGSFGSARERIKNFFEVCNPDQVTLLIGEHLADFANLVDHYLPKAAIDRIQYKARKTKMEHFGNSSDQIKEGSDE